MTATFIPPTSSADLFDFDRAEVAPTSAARIVPSSLPESVQGSYTTRHVAAALEEDPTGFHLISGPDVRPSAGDVVIARVTQVGNHKRLETPESRKAILFDGRVVMLAYGNRYATDQFLSHVPDSLGPASLVAAGGIAGIVTAAHAKMGPPTAIEPLGLLSDAEGVVNIARFAPFHNAEPAQKDDAPAARPQVIAVLGTSMNSGKSTVMACLINGLVSTGLKVGAGKITGTGAGNDPMLYQDAGASRVLDFTDFGYPTTFRINMEEIRALTVNLVDALTDTDTDVVVVEIADGVYQKETACLLRDELFQNTVDHVIFSATDPIGARAGVQELQDAGLRVSAVSGVLTSSPLASAEASSVLEHFRVPVVGTFDLTDPIVAESVRAPMASAPDRTS